MFCRNGRSPRQWWTVLYRALEKRQRIRVVTRYVHCIRGTLTGYLIAFDKHMNLILQDADEHYSQPKRGASSHDALATDDDRIGRGNIDDNQDAEVKRRQRAYVGPRSTGADWTLRQWHMRQVLVRGDSVVLVYLATAERSAFPVTAQSPTQSQYQRSNESGSRLVQAQPDGERVGTPGSLILVAQRRSTSSRPHTQEHGRNQKRDYAT